jgi:RNA polymerase sigma-70 factor (ECF subfamily)
LNSSDAEDLVHATAVRVLTFADRYVPGTNFKAWVTTILRNRFYSLYRRESRIVCSIDELPEGRLAIGPAQESAIELFDLQRVLARLPKEHQQALEDVASGFDYEEAARRRGCPTGTIKSRVFRARQGLRQFLL